MDTLYTFRENITHYKTESVHFFALMNSATKRKSLNPVQLREKPEILSLKLSSDARMAAGNLG